MAQIGEAVARYHRLLETPAYRDLVWAEALQERMRELRLTESGRLVAPILRPHFLSKRQHASLVRAVEGISAILDRLAPVILSSPVLMNRLQMLPAEKLLAAVPVRHARFSITTLMDTRVLNGSLHFAGIQAQTPPGVAYSDALADLFLDLPLTRDFRRGRYRLSKLGHAKQLLSSILKAWKEFGGKAPPRVAILEFKQQSDSSEGLLLAESWQRAGVSTLLVSPEQLEYQDGVLRAGDFHADVVFRRVSAQDLLVRYDLSHPLFGAYRDGAVCVVNGFRSEFAQRRALFELLTDDALIAPLPAAERKLIRDFIPWTRVVATVKTKYRDEVVDLPEFIVAHREQLVLRPNDDTPEQRTFVGVETDQPNWERAVRAAFRTPYVVQEHIPVARHTFPVLQYGELQMRDLDVAVHPHVFSGKMHGASAVLTSATNGFSSPVAIAPVLLLEET